MTSKGLLTINPNAEATSDNVAPAGQTVVEDSIHLDYEKLQLTPEVLANLTSHGLTGSDAFQFADNSKAKASWGSNDRCRVMPGDEDWPNKFEWFALDLLTGGALIEGKPQAAACYEDWPEYDPEECKVITSNWTNPYFQ